ncbi:MAG: hypothetical protein KDD45_00485, partial [Bdellovibrionales bacterium]|nr:hypothetical protein [Bdellovibrionales bacterium]
ITKFKTNITLALVKCDSQQSPDDSQVTKCSLNSQSMKSENVEINLDNCHTIQEQQVCFGTWSSSLNVSGSSVEAVVAVGQGASGPTFLNFKFKDQPATISLQLTQNQLIDAATLIGKSFVDPSNPDTTLTPFIAISPSSQISIYSLRRAFQLK